MNSMHSMNLFQWLALSLLLGMLVYEMYLAANGGVLRRFWALRVLTWIASGLAIYQPSLLTRLATIMGIQRGADLVLYVAVLLFVGMSIFLYGRCLRLQKQITQIVRHIAIRDANEPNKN